MGFFKKFMEKLNQGFLYVVDINTFKEYLEFELKFSMENNLEASAHCNIYYNGEKHQVQVWNYQASTFIDEQVKGLVVYYDEAEYKSINQLMEEATIFETKLKDINGYFKIEVLDTDSEFLNNYKKDHPELKVEDYN